ncbi:D-glycero-beta-D-manno-heptose 1,7-bisphosphate 7-phosphatase [Sodalis endosymbiont of Henestaris halophilus]|uniref:D-glycero-beta-D-manno-heptose 1,7-bisphosphate 7-phosphatase n=1 Tax=Sodalis endosymbiont of Henestaris halophilus TaxID=1929246 RepID=UPI000BC0561A|nr:D-glycero-beta-D-manno-heptose 1,7-bisphosphate 7-phosphatase [Sodalis endosymbiont of Henestaris halophilus]SNC58428.1 D-glycero-beta-D-manno-heptose-1,7-bisphosphate 7-phosphatase [Sodalis endosymbiont of Henestaris halophilus]
MAPSVSAIFLDRDGTINTDNGYVYKIADFHFIEDVITTMQKLKKMFFSLVMVTNQSGMARGRFNEEQFMRLIKWIDWSLADHDVNLDGIYFCPHHPQAVVKKLRQDCSCRKPKPGMLLDAQCHMHIDMASSYMVGDKLDDMLAGRAAGIGTKVLVRSGKLVTKQAIEASDWVIDSLASLPDAIKKHQTRM